MGIPLQPDFSRPDTLTEPRDRIGGGGRTIVDRMLFVIKLRLTNADQQAPQNADPDDRFNDRKFLPAPLASQRLWPLWHRQVLIRRATGSTQLRAHALVVSA